MANAAFRPKAYVKEGCPFSFKLLVFLAETGVLKDVDIERVSQAGPALEMVKAHLSDELGKAATFPTVEIEPDRYLADSDTLIEHFARRANVNVDSLPVLRFYKETMFPLLIELHQLKSARKAS
jgi:hypothetical protein